MSKSYVYFCAFGLHLYFSPPAIAGTREDILASATPTQRAEVQRQLCVLDKLGWKFSEQDSPSKKILSLDEKACYFDTPESAHHSGSLIIPKPRSIDELRSKLGEIIKGSGSLCAYKMKYKEAELKAVTKLKQSEVQERYLFTSSGNLEGDHIGGPQGSALPVEGWSKGAGCVFPKGGIKNAVESIYSNKSVAECMVGLSISNLATVWELFGEDADHLFTKDELRLDTWSGLQKKGNFWYDSNQASERTLKKYASLGPNALVGLSGVLTAKNPAKVDSPVNTNENLILTNISSGAAEKIASSGLSKIDRDLSKIDAWDGVEDINEVGTDLLRGVNVYVHPSKEMNHSLGTMGALLRNANSRTDYSLKIYSTKVNERVFDAYIKHLGNKCLL